MHVLATDGCFYNDDAFMVCPPPVTGELEKLFRYEVFKMLNDSCDGVSKVIYQSKDATSVETFDALRGIEIELTFLQEVMRENLLKYHYTLPQRRRV